MLSRLAKSAFIAGLLSGCAAQPRPVLPDDGAVQRARQALGRVFPAQYRSTQRAIITAAGRQFTCDGLLTVSPADGCHLALVSTFGVVADLRVKAGGAVEVLKVTPIFREDWSRKFVARDVRWLFGPPPPLQPGGLLDDGRLVLRSAPDSAGVIAEYIFSADGARWRELDLTRKGKIFYRAVVKRPDEFDVTAESYRLELRVAGMSNMEVQP